MLAFLIMSSTVRSILKTLHSEFQTRWERADIAKCSLEMLMIVERNGFLSSSSGSCSCCICSCSCSCSCSISSQRRRSHSSSGCLLPVILAVSLNNNPSKKQNTELDHAKPQGFDVDKCFDVTYPEAQ